MSEFSKLCKYVEKLDPIEYDLILTQKSAEIIPELIGLTENGVSGIVIFSHFILGAIAADGDLAEEEYLLIAPRLKQVFGENIDYDDCKTFVKSLRPESKELKENLVEMTKLLNEVSSSLADDIIIVCMLVCAIDGKISAKEKAWIKKLIG